jgi:pimeloyl-ACP methyl ester carboxylesterase
MKHLLSLALLCATLCTFAQPAKIHYGNNPAALWILPNSGHSTPVVYADLFNKTVDDFFTKKFRDISKAGRFN